MVAALTFYSGTNLNIKRLVRVFKRHVVILVVKAIVSILLSLGYIYLFGQEGILGISAVAFVVAISSANPAIYMSIVEPYGDDDDPTAFGLTGLFSIPLFPIFIYSLIAGSAGGGMDWTPVITTLVPLIIGVILGNIDPEFGEVFSPGIGAILPLLGWNLGQGMDLVAAIKAGGPGLILTVVFILLNSYLFFLDYNVLGNNGVVGLALISVAGVSVSTPAVLGSLYPEIVGNYVLDATSQLLLVCVITSILAPIASQMQYKHYYGIDGALTDN